MLRLWHQWRARKWFKLACLRAEIAVEDHDDKATIMKQHHQFMIAYDTLDYHAKKLGFANANKYFDHELDRHLERRSKSQ